MFVYDGERNRHELEGRTRAGDLRDGREVDEMKDIWRVIGIIALGLVVLVIGVPLLLAATGIALGVLGMIIGLAVAAIKLAVVVAIGYLVLVAVRSLMR